jgi:hypothetical protein
MKRQVIRILALLWLGWYFSGPLAAAFDFWDSPQEEMKDIARDAGGGVTLLAAAICIGIAQARKLRKRWLRLVASLRRGFLRSTIKSQLSAALAVPEPTHSPPRAPLRI